MDIGAQLKQLEIHLADLMQADAAWCRKRLRAAARRIREGKPAEHMLSQLEQRVRRSRQQSESRRAAVPSTRYDPALPITSRRDDILEAIRKHQVVIVAGETGSGKTTQLPKMCLDAGLGTRGFIGCTQPRRIAARAMAERVSEELGTEMGKQVGYQVRFRDHTHEDGYVKFMTDGILLAETSHDRHLDAYDALIIDEAHERSLNIDFLLGYLHTLLPKRPDLKVIITSATIDTEKFARHFHDAPVIAVSGRGYPVDIVYQPLSDEAGDEPGGRHLYRGIADAVTRLGRTDPAGDILVFLSGEREIHEAADFLGRSGLRHTEVLPLYARLSAGDQRRVFHPGPERRVILSTNVAETSLTVPRIRFVVDSGIARISRYDHRSRIQRLPIEAVSQASANQRAGRCGRLGPGTCVRLYEEGDFDLRPEFTEPEILRTSLATVILRMRVMGLGAVEDFPFIDPPAPRMINEAYNLLFELQAIDADREPTKLGRSLARWPLDVRLARMVVEGERKKCLEDLLVLVAALSIQDPRERPLDAQAAADEAHERFSDEKSDFVTLLSLWAQLRKLRRKLTGNQFRKQCRREFLNWQRVLEWFDLYQQLRDRAREERLHLRGGHGDYAAVHRALLSGLLSHTGRKDPEGHGYGGPRGRSFHIFPGSGLFGRSPPWLMSAEIVETTRTYARINARIEPAWIEEQGAHLLKRSHGDPHWSRRRGRVMAFEQVSLFGLVLAEQRSVDFSVIDPAEAQRIFILEALVRGQLDTRAAFLQENEALRLEIEEMEHKRRRRDVLSDETEQAGFYAARIPGHVCTAKTFEAWYAGLSEPLRRQLIMGHEVLMRDTAGMSPGEQFPDHLRAGGNSLPLSYRFEPGAEDDGVTVTVPLELLNLLDTSTAEWLVPGLLRDKIVELIRGLPKPVRRVLTPPARFADAALESLRPGSGSMMTQLAERLQALAGIEIEAAEFDENALPPHLRLRVAVLGAKGDTLASGRDLAALQAQLGGRARRRFMDRQGKRFNRDGKTSWAFGELPMEWRTPAGARAWPALVDQQDAVGLRLFDTQDEAAASHHEGVLRLLALQLSDKMRWLQKHHGLRNQGMVSWSVLGSPNRLVRELVHASLEQATGYATLEVRDKAAFERLLQAVRGRLGAVFRQLADMLEDSLESWRQVLNLLTDEFTRRRPAVAGDVGEQLEDLLYDGFLAELEPGRLQMYPRYLSAMLHRLQQVENNPVRDLDRMTLVKPYWQRYLEHLERGVYDEALDQYRWLLEEYRVSLFAQHLGIPVKVSPARLEEAWKRVVAAL